MEDFGDARTYYLSSKKKEQQVERFVQSSIDEDVQEDHVRPLRGDSRLRHPRPRPRRHLPESLRRRWMRRDPRALPEGARRSRLPHRLRRQRRVLQVSVQRGALSAKITFSLDGPLPARGGPQVKKLNQIKPVLLVLLRGAK